MAVAADACYEFLKFWGLRDLELLAAEPETTVATMDHPTRCVIYTGVHELLDEIHAADLDRPLPGLAAYVFPEAGKESSWQLASLTCDAVVLQRPQWDPDYFGGAQLRHYNWTTGTDGRPEWVGDGVPASRAVDPVSDAVAELLDDLLGELEAEETTKREYFERALPGALCAYLRFVACLASLGEGVDVRVVDLPFDDPTSLYENLKDYVEINGHLVHPSDPRALRFRPGSLTHFKDDIVDIWNRCGGRVMNGEVLGAYIAGELFGRDRLPLVSRSEESVGGAAFMFSRFRRLGYTTGGLPIEEAQRHAGVASVDWRPALFDKLLVGAFPDLHGASVDLFRSLSTSNEIEALRHRLRMDALRVEAAPAAEVAERLREIEAGLQGVAQAASRKIVEGRAELRRHRIETVSAGAIGLGIGFVTAGPALMLLGGLAGASLTAVVQRGALDPAAELDGTELALLRFSQAT